MTINNQGNPGPNHCDDCGDDFTGTRQDHNDNECLARLCPFCLNEFPDPLPMVGDDRMCTRCRANMREEDAGEFDRDSEEDDDGAA
jgi:hypothetical protein